MFLEWNITSTAFYLCRPDSLLWLVLGENHDVPRTHPCDIHVGKHHVVREHMELGSDPLSVLVPSIESDDLLFGPAANSG